MSYPEILERSKTHSFSYFAVLSNNQVIHFSLIEGPYEEGGQFWYDLRTVHSYIDILPGEPLEKIITVNANSITLLCESEKRVKT